MGLSKQLVPEQSSFESHGAGGSSGWQSPEQLRARDGGAVRQTRSMDVFSLGCVLHFCLTGGARGRGGGGEGGDYVGLRRREMSKLTGGGGGCCTALATPHPARTGVGNP